VHVPTRPEHERALEVPATEKTAPPSAPGLRNLGCRQHVAFAH
jgi:hypothetical protein